MSINTVKPLNFSEFKSYTLWCESILSGAQLQEVWTNDLMIVFEFYKFRNLWLVVDLDLSHPQIILLQQRSPPRTKKQKPIGLFINSHGKNLRVTSLKSVLQLGRVARLELGSLVEKESKSCFIEIQVVPRSPNMIVNAEGKKLSWSKPVELPVVNESAIEIIIGKEEEWLERENQWMHEKYSPQSQISKTETLSREKILAKKEKALIALRLTQESLDSVDLRRYGDLKASRQEIPEPLKKFSKLSIVEAFERAKQLERKKIGTEERIQKLQQEVESLKSGEALLVLPKSSGMKSMAKAAAKGRKLVLGPNLDAVCGKSARDNLAILRQARAWDLWMHLKDYPGAHGIIFREKGKNVDHHVIQKVAEWIIEESPAARGFDWGTKYEVVLTECRFVRPIKGDKLGRVTYQNPTVYSFASKKK